MDNYAEGCRAEPGCLHFDLLPVERNDVKFVLYQTFSGQKAMKLHLKTAHFKEWIEWESVLGNVVNSTAVKCSKDQSELVDKTGNSDSAAYKLNTGATFWFTGLSGSGKSTLSEAVKKRLDSMLGDENKAFILDGDIIRTGLNKDLGFSKEDRQENVRRITEVAKLMAMSGQICIVAFISPYE